MSIPVVSSGTVRAVEQAAGPTPSYGGSAVLQIPFLPDLLRDQTAARARGLLFDPELVYDRQPAVRKAVDYLVGKFQRVPLHGHIRVSLDERLPIESGDLYDVVRQPWPRTPMSRFAGELLRDRLLWDRWAVLPMRDQTGRARLRRLPPRMWQPIIDGFGDVVEVRLGNGYPLSPESVVLWHGREGGRSPMRAIQDELLGLIQAAKFRDQIFARGGRFEHVIERPLEAPKWSDPAASGFSSSFADKYGGDGSQAGEIPVLEEGMKLHEVKAFSPVDAQLIEGVTLGGILVCGFFHLAPELLGLRQGNYSNMDAFRQGLYTETLGEYYVSFQDELNEQLVPIIADDPRSYVEFMLEAALAGSFLEQAEAYSRSTGAPWLLRSEARAKSNLPPVAGLDEPVVPLNVLVGGLSSPADTAPPKMLGDRRESAARTAAGTKADVLVDRLRDRLAGELEAFYAEQSDAVVGQLTSAAKDVAPMVEWDAEHWDTRLAAIILRSSPAVAAVGARGVLERFDPEYDWSDDPMAGWLRAAAANTAKRTNQATEAQITAAAATPEWRDAVPAVFAARAARAPALATSITTETRSFGGHEAAKAVGARSKRWVVTSTNPRSSHAAIDGQTVPIDALFSNGGRYPGDHTLSPDERAGCTCRLEYIGGSS